MRIRNILGAAAVFLIVVLGSRMVVAGEHVSRPRVNLHRIIRVDYRQPWNEMIRRAHIGYVDTNAAALSEHKSGVQTLEMALFRTRSDDASEIIRQMSDRGFRPGTIEELCAFHDHAVDQNGVIALGTLANVRGQRVMPLLYYCFPDPDLDLIPVGYLKKYTYDYLVVKK